MSYLTPDNLLTLAAALATLATGLVAAWRRISPVLTEALTLLRQAKA
jgi:hypothetical protein